MKIALIILCFFCTASVHAQEKKPSGDSGAHPIFKYVDKMPEAGYDFNTYFSKSFHSTDSVNKGIGKVIVKFVVNEDGEISNCTIVNGHGEKIEDDVLQVICKMPKWHPGLQNGKPVKVWYTLPIYIEPE